MQVSAPAVSLCEDNVTFCGIKIGHATNEEMHTGCTVFLCPDDTVGSVDVRGPAPGSRESALLAIDKPNRPVNAVVLSGGSAFGLATADGVVSYLAERDVGWPTPVRPVPIVPAAIVYDLFLNGGKAPPDAQMGYAAAVAAGDDEPAQGSVGAGAGVTVGKWAGSLHMMKGGFGVARDTVEGVTVCAAAVVNSVGDVVNEDGTVLAGARANDGTWLASADRYRRYPPQEPPILGTNSTLVVVATDVRLSRVGCNRLAQRSHNGIALAIRPAHTTHDGDTLFALSTGQDGPVLGGSAGAAARPFDLVCNMAEVMVAEAIRNAVKNATSVGDVPGLRDQR